jgi:4-hydroxythreonine-4-phosphate dehydrogenase
VTRVLAIADDLTGALEVGARFAAAGMRSVVTTGSAAAFEDAVIVIDTETRHASPADAESIVAARAARWHSLVYKKTDSTLRGNIAAELRALHRLYGGPIAYVPAYPEVGRTVIDGVVHVDGVPLHETSFASDRLNPVRDGRVASLVDPACDCVVFDGRDSADVLRAAQTILDSGYRIVAGPGAIAGALAACLGTPAEVVWPSLPNCLVVTGSRHEVSSRQIECALATGAIATDENAPWRLFQWEIPGTADPLAVAEETGRRVRDLLAARRYDGLLVFGGDTAFGILQSLGAPPVRPLGEIQPGVPVSFMTGRSEVLITKAGGFGPPDLVARLRKNLNDHR